MRFVFAIIFLTLAGCTLLYYYKKEKDLFSPMVFFCFMSIMHYVPGIWYITDYSYIKIDESMVLIVLLYESIVLISTAFGYTIYTKTNKSILNEYKVVYNARFSLHTIGVFLYIIGFLAGLLYIRVNGGFAFIISGIKNVQAGNGNSYIRALMFLMVLGMCLILKYRTTKGLKPISIELILLFAVYAFFFVIQTSRSPVLEALMILIILNHYCGNRISFKSIFRLKNVLIAFVAIIYIVIMPSFRSSKGFEDFSLVSAVSSGAKNISNVFDELCYTGRDGFIYMNYDFDKRWHGGNIINLLIAPIPSSLYNAKPPVDDGMYLANAVIGHYTKPPNSDLPWYNSLPLTTPGGLYINFGFFGLVMGSVILGYVYGAAYAKLKKTRYDVVSVIFYQLVIYQLEFSSLSIVQTLTPAVIVYFFIFTLGGRRVVKCIQKE